MHRRRFLALALALPLLATGCPPPQAAGSGDLKIAFAGPLTGEASSLGLASKKGAELAVEERNAAGGIKGKKVVLMVEDDKGSAAEATNVAQKIVGDTDVSLVVGHFNSSCTLASRDTYNRIGVVQFSPGSTNVTVCRDAPFTFRNLYHDNYQGDLMAKYAKQLGLTKVAVAFDNDDYGRPLKDTIVAKARELGMEVTTEVAYNRGQTQDYKTLATTLQASAPQLVFISGLNESASLIAKAIRNDLGWKDVLILGSDGVMHPDFVKNAGDAAEGAFVVTPFFFSAEASPEARAFGDAFRKKYGEDPDTWAGLAYDAANMAMKALEEVGPDRKKVQEWFTSRRDKATGFQGVTGMTFFDEHGDCYSKPAQIVVVRNGGFALAEKQIAIE
jgi:branched-chain amino acid transport system substrate-binding protein